MRREGIYNEEKLIDSVLEGEIQERYRDWKTYVKTIEHYLPSKNWKKRDGSRSVKKLKIQTKTIRY
ncbi:hypothetical protein JCM9140_3430 [Halalkalibacter wakoensis JCM 9140]|uniref:Uncharacterized protein n=1 Tax=Halalkalibacter wakoensis JCM 9140 TaxID=1236970 RepID=W4Q6G7_9BACI|nr:hypothetical protein [Halalkalibacter wakoensis]GAE27298.1 hypothetical protein JCM9140_3430 [Halalkalibacter wakoensis JCM 9140]